MNFRPLAGGLVLILSTSMAPCFAADPYFTLQLKTGQRFDNVFSRTVALKANGYDEDVHRVSGSAMYVVLDPDAKNSTFDISYVYDGRAAGQGRCSYEMSTSKACYGSQCQLATDGSGLLFSTFLWGRPPDDLKVGDTWTVSIPQPWELGPSGKQKVTVLSLDKVSHLIMLEREGSGTGPFDGDKTELDLAKGGKTLYVAVTAGDAHWHGYTLFRDGIVISDELMVVRSLTLTASGQAPIAATQRQYILLNASPPA